MNDIDICIQLLHIGDSILMMNYQLENTIVDALLIPIIQYKYEYDENHIYLIKKYEIKYLDKFVIITILSVFSQLVEFIENKIDKI